MKESLRGIIGAASTLLLIGLFVVAVAPVSAGEVDLKIKALEQELTQLKVEQEEAIEASRAAAAKMPTFRYRPGSGLVIGAADKSWSINFRYRFHIHMYNQTDGADHRGGNTGDLFVRRSRWRQIMCWEGCFYELESALDLDTGNIADSQTLKLTFRLDKLNPVLPSLWVADKGGQTASYVGRSSSSSANVELARDILDDRRKITLSHRGIGFGWINQPVGQGDFLLAIEYETGSQFDKNVVSDTDRKQLFVKAGMRPWRKAKNKWIKWIKFGIGFQTMSNDPRGNNGVGTSNNTAGPLNRLALRSTDRNMRIRVIDIRDIGRGQHTYVEEGFEWKIGPYLMRINGGQSRWENEGNGGGGTSGQFFGAGHEIFLWSPKGFLTGSPSKAGSLQLGYRFLRGEAKCGFANCDRDSEMSSNHYYINEVDLWYYIKNKLSVGIWWTHHNAANVPEREQVVIGCSGNSSTSRGKDCTWDAVNLGLRMDW
jgi:hypothetical protein